MNPKQLANKLNGREYGEEMTKEEEAEAKAAGLVVVTGYSDDNMELRGAIYDEFSCYEGGTAYVTPDGFLQECDSPCEHCDLDTYKKLAVKIEAIWNKDGYSWQYKTDIPHATFEIMEDDEKYCRGIVFKLEDLKR